MAVPRLSSAAPRRRDEACTGDARCVEMNASGMRRSVRFLAPEASARGLRARALVCLWKGFRLLIDVRGHLRGPHKCEARHGILIAVSAAGFSPLAPSLS